MRLEPHRTWISLTTAGGLLVAIVTVSLAVGADRERLRQHDLAIGELREAHKEAMIEIRKSVDRFDAFAQASITDRSALRAQFEAYNRILQIGVDAVKTLSDEFHEHMRDTATGKIGGRE